MCIFLFQYLWVWRASSNGHIDCVRLLVEAGANISTPSKKGSTCGNFHLFFLRKLKMQCLSLCRSGEGKSGCFTISWFWRGELIKAKQLWDYTTYKLQFLFLFQDPCIWVAAAAWNGRLDCVRWFIEKGENLDTQDNDGRTPGFEIWMCVFFWFEYF